MLTQDAKRRMWALRLSTIFGADLAVVSVFQSPSDEAVWSALQTVEGVIGVLRGMNRVRTEDYCRQGWALLDQVRLPALTGEPS